MDLIEVRRKLLVADPELPPMYRRVEYLQSSGVQYIKSPLTDIYGWKIRITTFDLGNKDSAGYFGWWNSGSQNELQMAAHKVVIAYGSDNATHDIGTPFDGLIVADGAQITANGTTYMANVKPPNINVPFALFGYNRTTGVVNCSGSCRIYYAVFYNSQHGIIGNFIPCIRTSDNKPGMYDSVSKTFFTNEGTGEFVIPT